MPILSRLVVFSLLAAVCARFADADVIVLANRTRGQVHVKIRPLTSLVEQLTLRSGDVIPIFNDGRLNVAFDDGGQERQHLLNANSAYYFGKTKQGRILLQQIGLGGDASTSGGRRLPGSARQAHTVTIPVMILVDEEEPTRRPIWQRRLRRRVEAASQIIEKHCHVRFEVTAVGTWDSDDRTSDFFDSLREFEREVSPLPARLALGFTSQYPVVEGRTHLGGTRGPLRSHILLREWSPNVGEVERTELLVHELGHYLGASHSPEPDSVMRPILGDRQARRTSFQIRFDPVNTLVIAMIGEEMRRRNVRSIDDLTRGSKKRLSQVYGELSKAFPEDPAGRQFVRIVDRAQVSPLVQGSRTVLREIVRAANENKRLPVSGNSDIGRPARRQGDELTDYYVRRAAAAAGRLNDETGPAALVLALGIGLGDSRTLSQFSKLRLIAFQLETPGERAVRQALLGEPTIHQRRDLAKHFFVSAYVAATASAHVAETAGLAKELHDANGGSGFSFADLTANKAGVLFADGVLRKRLSLRALANGFTVSDFVPAVDDVQEGLTAEELAADYGDGSDRRFQEELRGIERRIGDLPPYQRVGGLSRSP